MDSSMIRDADKFLRKHQKHKRYVALLLCLAFVVTLGTVSALRIHGKAMNYTKRVLNCQLKVHEHTSECYNEKHELICGRADYVVHTHNDDCYDADGNLVCQLPEIKEHKHDESCYSMVKTLICTQPEVEPHTHTDACYTTTQGELTCTLQEHAHTEACYDEAGTLTCGLEEHTHNENCYEQTRELTCGIEEGTGHIHTDACYQETKELTCGKLELHTHNDNCYKIQPNGSKELICDKTVLEKHIHWEECFTTEELTPEEIEALAEKETQTEEEPTGEETEDTEPKVVFSDVDGDKTEDEQEATATAEAEPAKSEDNPDAETEDNPDAETEGNPEGEAETTTAAEIPEDALTQQYKDEQVVVTAYYGPEADLPEEAKLTVSAVTKESDPEHYEQRLDSALAAVDAEASEDVTAQLLKIGFFLPDGTEVEPAAPVILKVQFLENGVPVGDPMKVVHFADDGTETYSVDSGDAFSVDGFSEFMFVRGPDTPAPIANTDADANISGAKVAGDGLNEKGELKLGEKCTYECTAKLGSTEWEMQLPASMSWEAGQEEIRTIVDGEQVVVGTITTTKDGKVTYTPNPDCPPAAYNNNDVQNYSFHANFTVTETRNAGISFPGIPDTYTFEPRNMEGFLTDAKLTQEGVEVQNGDKLVVGEHYTYSVEFKEKGAGLLDGFSTPMYFQMPDNVQCTPVDHKAIYDRNYGPDPVGWYSVDENGLVTFEFDEKYLSSKSNLKLNLDFELTVAADSEGIVDFPWDNDGFSKTFQTDPVPDATLEKQEGEYNATDPGGPCIDYTVKLEITKGVVENPTLADEMEPGLSYREGSGKVTVTDRNGNDITDSLDPPPQLKWTENGWEVENMPDSLEKGQQVIVTYKSDVEFDKGDGTASGKTLVFPVENNAVFQGDSPVEGVPPIEREDNVTDTLYDTRITKDGSVDQEKGLIDWEIVVGSGSTDVRGAVVTDKLSGKQWIDESQDLEIKWKEPVNHTVKTYKIPWDQAEQYGLTPVYDTENPDHIVGFTFTIPTEGTLYKDGENFWTEDEEGNPRPWQNGDSVKLEYYTTYDETATNFGNTATVEADDQTFKGEKNVGIGAGTISKGGQEVEDGAYMEYQVTLSLPSAEDLGKVMGDTSSTSDGVRRTRFCIEDQLEIPSVKRYDEDNNERRVRYFVDNIPEDVTITATLEDGTVIHFIKDGTGDNSFRVAQYGVDYHTDWADGEKGHREFQIWFNTQYAYTGDGMSRDDSFWILDQPCELTITYRVPTNSKLYVEDPQNSGSYSETDLTLREVMDEGWTLENSAKARGKSNDFGATHEYTTLRPEYDVTKDAKVLQTDDTDPFKNEIEYRVEFNAFTTDPFTGEIGKARLDPKTFGLVDTFDSRLEYVPGSMQVEVYSPERRLRYIFGADEGTVEITEGPDGTSLSVDAMDFNTRRFVSDYNKGDKSETGGYPTLKYYMAHDNGDGTPRDIDALYVFVYRLRLKSDAITGGSLTLNNHADVHYGGESKGDDATVDIVADALLKNGVHEHDDYGTDIVVYTVEVNPGAIDLVQTDREDLNPGRYTLIDTMDELLTLRSDSVKVYSINNETGEETLLTQVADQAEVTPEAMKYVLQEAENHTFKLILPDNQHLRIEYSADINANKNETVSVTNTVELEGGMSITDKDDSNFTMDGDNAHITGDAKMRLFKQDANTGNYIDGAEFELYVQSEIAGQTAKIGGEEYSFIEYATLKPDALTGTEIAKYETDNNDSPKYYLLVETKAPNGYLLNEEPVVIVFHAKGEDDPETLEVVYNGTTYPDAKVYYITTGDNVVVVEDELSTYTLPETGGTGDYLCAAGVMLMLIGIVLLMYKEQKRRARGGG